MAEIAAKKNEVEKNLEDYCTTLSDNIFKNILKKDEKISKENFKKLKGNLHAISILESSTFWVASSFIIFILLTLKPLKEFLTLH